MSLLFATQITAIATAVLAVGAIVTAIFAVLALRKEAEEVRAIEKQVTDQQEVTRQQAGLLKLQSEQLELQRQQLDDQRKVNEKHSGVLELEAAELTEALRQRQHDAAEQRRKQAARVTACSPGRRTRCPGPGGHLSGTPRTSPSSMSACSSITCGKRRAAAMRRSTREGRRHARQSRPAAGRRPLRCDPGGRPGHVREHHH